MKRQFDPLNRRSLLSTTVLVTPALALAACAVSGPAPTVQSVFNQIQYLLPLIRALVAGMAIAVPGSAALVNAALPYLDEAGVAFQLLEATMPVPTAMPIVQQVETYAKSAVDTLANIVNSAGAGSKLAQFAPEVAEGQAVLALITAFANGVQAMPMTARFRSVSLPLLHH